MLEKSFDKKNVGKINYKRKVFINKIYSNIITPRPLGYIMNFGSAHFAHFVKNYFRGLQNQMIISSRPMSSSWQLKLQYLILMKVLFFFPQLLYSESFFLSIHLYFSFPEFQTWKCTMEKDLMFFSVWSKKGNMLYYQCHRSGSSRPRGKGKRLKWKQTCRTGLLLKSFPNQLIWKRFQFRKL